MRWLTSFAVMIGAVLAFAAAARADYRAVLEDCGDDERLTRTYLIEDYSQALRHLNTDLDEYSDCRNVISRARLLAIGSRGAPVKDDPAASPPAGDPSVRVAPASSAVDQAPPPVDPLPDSSQKSPEQILQAATPAQRAAIGRLRTHEPRVRPTPIVSEQRLSFDGDSGAVNRLPAPVILALTLLALAGVFLLFVAVRRSR